MSHRKDRKETLRLERERREAEARAAQQRKRLVGYVAVAAMAVAAIAVVVVLAAGGGGDGEGGGVKGSGDNFPSGGSVPEQQVFDLRQAAEAAGCELKDSRSRSRDHTQDAGEKVDYPDNPPTSGRHYEIPAEDGLYNGPPPPDTALVHSLEHGRVIIWVKPDLPREARQKIRALFDEDSYQMIVVRRPKMPYAIAATAWSHDPSPLGTGRTMGCDQWSDDVIDALRAFRDEHRSNGPEPIP
ncbi:MAG: hypothetical protein QOH58_1929 [Thermoleophilaceae bacterium]|jgi:hypothetical protein|nr:hypothetical protein [Thermoleophilaceae bacterium]